MTSGGRWVLGIFGIFMGVRSGGGFGVGSMLVGCGPGSRFMMAILVLAGLTPDVDR